jgi:V/A-type H+-transporting ATPase subunit E
LSSAALDRVVREVVEDTLGRIRAELESALGEALRAVERVENETLRELSAISSSGAAARESVRQRIVSLAEISAKNKAIAVVEDGVKRVFERALEEIGRRAGQPGFSPTMRRLLIDAVDALNAKDVVAESNSEGLRILREIVAGVEGEKGVRIRLADRPIETIAGVRVRTLDGSRICDNTVEARLERMRPFLRREIASILMRRM